MEMDIRYLNSDIAKRVIDPNDLMIGMFVSRVDYEGKKIENRYYIGSIKSKFVITPLYKNRKKVVTKVRCYDMIADKFVDFTGAALLKFLQPSSTDYYDYQYTPVGENNNLKEDDYVIFIEPKKIQMVVNRNRPKHVFLITSRYNYKYGGEYADLVDANGDNLIGVPVEFLTPVEFVNEDDSKKFLKIKNDMKGDDDEPEVNKESYDKLEEFANKVEDLKDKLDLPKEFLDNKKVNFGFSFSVNDAGLKIDFHDENHNSMSQTFIDFNKNDFNSIEQMVSKYVTALSMLMLNFNKININEKTIFRKFYSFNK